MTARGRLGWQTAMIWPQIWEQMEGAPCVLEGFIPFTTEISVIAARGMGGQTACFDVGENLHEAGILRTTTVPATVPRAHQMDAVLMAGQILNALSYIGVMGIEFFVDRFWPYHQRNRAKGA